MAVADVLNPDFYVLSFIKLMEDELEERRKSSRRELFRNNDCQKELFVRLSHSHLCGFNRCLESRISQLDECCAIIGASQTTPPYDKLPTNQPRPLQLEPDAQDDAAAQDPHGGTQVVQKHQCTESPAPGDEEKLNIRH